MYLNKISIIVTHQIYLSSWSSRPITSTSNLNNRDPSHLPQPSDNLALEHRDRSHPSHFLIITTHHIYLSSWSSWLNNPISALDHRDPSYLYLHSIIVTSIWEWFFFIWAVNRYIPLNSSIWWWDDWWMESFSWMQRRLFLCDYL